MEKPTAEQIADWYPRLFRTALRMTGSAEDAADVTQQTFLKALARWSQFDGRGTATTWLHGILVNCIRDWARRRAVRDSKTPDPWQAIAVDAEQTGMAEDAAKKEALACLREAIDSLPATLRCTFVAVVLDGYTYQKAAELLSVPVGTVGSRISDARRRIRQAMRRKFPEA